MKTLEDIGLSVNEQYSLESIVSSYKNKSAVIMVGNDATVDEMNESERFYHDDVLPHFISPFLRDTVEFIECGQILEKTVRHLSQIRVLKKDAEELYTIESRRSFGVNYEKLGMRSIIKQTLDKVITLRQALRLTDKYKEFYLQMKSSLLAKDYSLLDFLVANPGLDTDNLDMSMISNFNKTFAESVAELAWNAFVTTWSLDSNKKNFIDGVIGTTSSMSLFSGTESVGRRSNMILRAQAVSPVQEISSDDVYLDKNGVKYKLTGESTYCKAIVKNRISLGESGGVVVLVPIFYTYGRARQVG